MKKKKTNKKKLGCWMTLHNFDTYINKDHIECNNCGMVVNSKGKVREDFIKQFRTEKMIVRLVPIVILIVIILAIIT